MTEDSLQVDDALVPFDTTVPNVARIYDFLLQGKDNFAADRRAGEELLKAVPTAAEAARDNRVFLGRVVEFLAREAGIRQFLYLGTGLPAAGSVHEKAQETDPLCHVVYADNDPIVISHANALLADSLRVAAVQADLRHPDRLLSMPTVRDSSISRSPSRVLMLAVLHFVADDQDPWSIVARYKSVMAPGSYLAISHVTGDGLPAEAIAEAAGVYEHASAPGTARTRTQVAQFFHGLDIAAPGLTDVRYWRDPFPARKAGPLLLYGGVGATPAATAAVT